MYFKHQSEPSLRQSRLLGICNFDLGSADLRHCTLNGAVDELLVCDEQLYGLLQVGLQLNHFCLAIATGKSEQKWGRGRPGQD